LPALGNAHRSAVERRPGLDNRQRRRHGREVAVIRQDIEHTPHRVGRHIERILHDEQEAVVRQRVVERVGIGLPVGELVQKLGDGGVISRLKRQEINARLACGCHV